MLENVSQSLATDPPPLPSIDSDPERIERFRIALAQAKSIKGAAKLLRVHTDKVHEALVLCPALTAYLPNSTPPTEAELLPAPSRLSVQPAHPGGEEEMLAGIAKADAQVRTGLAAMGIPASAIEEAVAMSAFARVSFESMGHMVNGGMASLYIELMAEVRKITKRIADGCEDGEPLDFEDEQMLRQDRSGLVKHLIDIAANTREASMTAAKIAQIRAETTESKNGAGRGKPRLGAAPLESAGIIKTIGPTEIRFGSRPSDS